MSSLFFTSNKNYMKRDVSTGSTSLAAPVTSAYGGSVYVTNYTFSHTLAMNPTFRVLYEPFKDGVIWPAMGSRQIGSVSNPNNLSQSGPGLIAWPGTNQITIQLFYFTNSLTGTYPVYFVPYRDYAL